MEGRKGLLVADIDADMAEKGARNAEKSQDAQTLPKRFDIVGLGRSSA